MSTGQKTGDRRLHVHDEGRTRVLTLNRPRVRNALDTGLCATLTGAICAAGREGTRSGHGVGPRALLLRGAPPAFCAGADLDEEHSPEFLDTLGELLLTLVECPLPVIADIQGPCIGAGLQLALASDLRVVGPDAWFGLPPAALGIALDDWTVGRCVDLIGGSRARGLMLGGLRMSATEAAACGFSNVSGGSQDAAELADRVAALAPLSVRQLKLALNDTGTAAVGTGAAARELYEACWASADAAEARAARTEKRGPVFTGR
ncbi:enoyl-CoA hydratase [Corynebacterium sp. CCM 9185]|uniref:Enoyl-CoA hydratase n=1 Tax=Corynebacterium marambiense TaxID=2765364 RepID=A0ABS0VU73_9CORY|nr:enoyl-CoA hydratase [Corynebacterium marambiense]MBI8999916.1 enoyl-CoA hydratase [Corynebacterium marambiense]MCK7663273.1 enoyl-CoA hydratase [Corynebacterium marambiense]MCX7542339.1 enoyl-CoA hydratase [Corynebacterium marambiense]